METQDIGNIDDVPKEESDQHLNMLHLQSYAPWVKQALQMSLKWWTAHHSKVPLVCEIRKCLKTINKTRRVNIPRQLCQ